MSDKVFSNGEYLSTCTKDTIKENIFIAMAKSLPENLQTCEACTYLLEECIEELKVKRVQLKRD